MPIIKHEALSSYLIYGSYPEIALARQNTERKLLLKDIYQSYLQKDIVDFLKIGDVSAFSKLLVVLANQNAGLLYLDKLAKVLALPRQEVKRFLTILEQTFIIKLIYPFFKNYRKEITKTTKMYFLDLGLRNFILSNFNEDLSTRQDLGALFENFYLLQLLHSDPYRLQKINFWRTTNQTEIDFIVSEGESRQAIEVKYNKTQPPKSFKTIAKYYPNIQTKLASKENFLR